MQVELWEALLAGALVLVVLFFFGPRVKRSMAQTPAADAGDWKAAIVPILLVAGFVALMILMIA